MDEFYRVGEFYRELKLLLKKYKVSLYAGDYGIVAKFKFDGRDYRENIEKITSKEE